MDLIETYKNFFEEEIDINTELKEECKLESNISCRILKQTKKNKIFKYSHSFEKDHILTKYNFKDDKKKIFMVHYYYEDKIKRKVNKITYTILQNFINNYFKEKKCYIYSYYLSYKFEYFKINRNYNFQYYFDISKSFYSIKYETVFSFIWKYIQESEISDKEKKIIKMLLIILLKEYQLIASSTKNNEYLFITSSAQVLFSFFLEIILKDFNNVIVFIDDFILYGNNKKELKDTINILLKKLKEYNLFTYKVKKLKY